MTKVQILAPFVQEFTKSQYSLNYYAFDENIKVTFVRLSDDLSRERKKPELPLFRRGQSIELLLKPLVRGPNIGAKGSNSSDLACL